MDYDYTYDIDDGVQLCAARLNAINALLTSYLAGNNQVDAANAYITSIKTHVIRSPGIKVILGNVNENEYQAPVLFSMMAYRSGCYRAKVKPFLKRQENINKDIVDEIREKISTDPSEYYKLLDENEMQIKTQLLKLPIFKKNSDKWNTESKKVFGDWEWDYNRAAEEAAKNYATAEKYRYGRGGYGKNMSTAIHLYTLAADAGHSEAQHDLANIFEGRANLAKYRDSNMEQYKKV